MYSTLGISKYSKGSGRLFGTHQQLDRAARKLFRKAYPSRAAKFPTALQILYFEGVRGPDGLKIKSPGVDEPEHFIIPDEDDGRLAQLISDHYYNLVQALRNNNEVRASFEAAWMSHAITDGLTPAHHFPLNEAREELMTEDDFIRIFGKPIKGLMHGRDLKETLHNNWIYWGKEGYMSKHVAFEYGVVLTATTFPERSFMPEMKLSDWKKRDALEIFYEALAEISKLDMYAEFCQFGWTPKIAKETREVLLPEIIKTLALTWNAAVMEAGEKEGLK